MRRAPIIPALLLPAIAFLSGCAADTAKPQQLSPGQATVSHVSRVRSHLDRIIEHGSDRFGPVHTGMWCANIDTRTGRPIEEHHVPRRVYRLIGAPRGSSLYWDQPLVLSAVLLSEMTGETKYALAAKRYIADFLERCIDADGMFEWGNHQYYDVFEDRTVKFQGGYHEMRPLTPAWELFWRQDSAKCSRFIRTMADRHVYDRETGGFNRHDDGKFGHPFLEAGGILVESLAWLYRKEKDSELLSLALAVAGFSHAHRGETTGLLRNSPGSRRWDDYTLTTEIGVWAQSLLRAAEHTGEQRFVEMAGNAVAAYLRHGFDPETEQYYGLLNVNDGTHVEPDSVGYWPRKYSDIWNTDQWPTHDYPMSLAEACLTLYELTGEELFLEGVKRWAAIVGSGISELDNRDTYAENYGRCIHFLVRAAGMLEDPRLTAAAGQLADKAVSRLFENGMFQGFPDTHLYESVDGVGYLCLALLALETGHAGDYGGFGF